MVDLYLLSVRGPMISGHLLLLYAKPFGCCADDYCTYRSLLWPGAEHQVYITPACGFKDPIHILIKLLILILLVDCRPLKSVMFWLHGLRLGLWFFFWRHLTLWGNFGPGSSWVSPGAWLEHVAYCRFLQTLLHTHIALVVITPLAWVIACMSIISGIPGGITQWDFM